MFGGESAASPSVSDDGGILFASGGDVLLSVDPTDGSNRFAVGYDDVADELLDPKPPIPFLIPNGNPTVTMASVISLSPGKVHVPASLGYMVEAAASILGRAIPIPHADVIINVSPEFGQVIPGGVTQTPDGIEGALSPLADGRMGVDQATIFRAISFYLLNPFLPPTYRTSVPKAGYIGFEPASFQEFALEQIDAVIGYTETAETEFPGGELQKRDRPSQPR